jgi:hypothetical protein
MKFEDMLREWSEEGSVYLTYDTPTLIADVIAAARASLAQEDVGGANYWRFEMAKALAALDAVAVEEEQ